METLTILSLLPETSKWLIFVFLNASNEEAVYAFLRGEIKFLEIEEIVEFMINSHRVIDEPTIDDIVYVDSLTRKLTLEEIKRRQEKCGM